MGYCWHCKEWHLERFYYHLLFGGLRIMCSSNKLRQVGVGGSHWSGKSWLLEVGKQGSHPVLLPPAVGTSVLSGFRGMVLGFAFSLAWSPGINALALTWGRTGRVGGHLVSSLLFPGLWVLERWQPAQLILSKQGLPSPSCVTTPPRGLWEQLLPSLIWLARNVKNPDSEWL